VLFGTAPPAPGPGERGAASKGSHP
jgi:hypothetical protein